MRELSEASPREVFGSAPLEGGGRPLSSSSAGAAGGLGRPQPTRRWLRPRLPGPGGGEGCGRTGPAASRTPPGRRGLPGVSRGFWWSSREAASALKRTCTRNSPSSPSHGHRSVLPLFVLLTPARCGTLRQLFAAGRASQQELCCAGVACRGVCRNETLKTIYGVPQRSLSAHSLF